MIVDGRSVGRDSVVHCDICIVGAGPAGLIAANEFLGEDHRVCVVESGGFEHDAATQLLARSEVEESDDLYPDPFFAHDRRVGGTSAQWDVMVDGKVHVHLMPLDAMDFRRRHWLPFSGWPIDDQTLAPYIARAQLASGAGSFDYRPEAWCDDQNKPFESALVDSKMVSCGAQDYFLQTLPNRLTASSNLTLMTWSTATEILVPPGAETVSSLQVACLDGNRFRVKALMVILAQGAFDVPRLLLASRSVRKQGLGNQHDLVGRYLMDRQIAKAGTLFPARPAEMRRFGFYDMREVRGRHVLGKFTLSEDLLESEELLGSLISFSPRQRYSLYQLAQSPFGRGTTCRSPAQRSLRDLRAAWRQRRLPSSPLRLARNMLSGLDDLLYLNLVRRLAFRPKFNFDSLGWSTAPDTDRFSSLEVHQMCEQSPDFENRVTLSEARDALGMPTARVAFRWNARDVHSVLRTQDILKQEFARLSIGDLRLERRGNFPLLANISAHHPSGTTRMASDPELGVVDAQCKVHGLSNLFVASSSVFPTSGCAPPTLTILALAIRVSDRIKCLLTKS